MTPKNKRLGEIEPRERIGAQTGRNYEYQYEQTASETLRIIEDPKVTCVYCDWHDDFVVEINTSTITRYHFHQVKSKKSSQMPWSFREIFGVPLPASLKTASLKKKKTAKAKVNPQGVDQTAILPRLLMHLANFGTFCEVIAFVTNCGVDNTVLNFLQKVRVCHGVDDLTSEIHEAVASTAALYLSEGLIPSVDDFFAALKTLTILIDRGSLSNPESALLQIGDKISQVSEVSLSTYEAKQVARELVAMVRKKVNCTDTVVPASDDVLRLEKGIVVAELLEILALSREGYERLRLGGVDGSTVKTLSRIHRFCKKSADLRDSIEHVCMFKAKWDIWRTQERHFLETVTYLQLEATAREYLLAGFTLRDLAEAAKEVAAKFSKASPLQTPLEPEHVLGLIFSLAAQSEVSNDL